MSSLSPEESPACRRPMIARLDVSSSWQHPIALSPVPSEMLMPGGKLGASKGVANSFQSSVRDHAKSSSRGVVRMYSRTSLKMGRRRV